MASASSMLVQSEDKLSQASRGFDGLMELVLALPDDKKISLTRGRLAGLIMPIEERMNESLRLLKAARAEMKTQQVS